MTVARFPIFTGMAFIGCTVAIVVVTGRFRTTPPIAAPTGIVVVRGPQPQAQRVATLGADQAPPLAQTGSDHAAEIASTIERSYPIVRDVRIACDDHSCEVSVTPKPSSSADEDRIADALLDGGLDRILSGYGYHSTAPVVVDVLGGVNTGFRQSVTRP